LAEALSPRIYSSMYEILFCASLVAFPAYSFLIEPVIGMKLYISQMDSYTISGLAIYYLGQSTLLIIGAAMVVCVVFCWREDYCFRTYPVPGCVCRVRSDAL